MAQKKLNNRVLIVCQHFWPESFRINDITEYLLEQGYEVDVLCGRPNYPSGKLAPGYTLWNRNKENFKGANVYRALEIPRRTNTNIWIFLNYISFPIFSLLYVPFFAAKKYDRIFIYQLSPVMMSIAGIIIGKLRKTEITMYVLDLWPENLFSVLHLKNDALRRMITAISHWHYKKVDRLVVLSEQMKEKLLSVTNKSKDDILILPQACEKLYEKNIHDKELVRRFSRQFNIVFTGNISPAQDFPTMIEAAKIIKESGVDDVHWIIVGDGMSRDQVERSVAHNNLSEHFSFEGHRPIEDIPKYTFLADVLIGCLVKSELLEATVPAKVMSYIASGRPIVLAMDGEAQKLVNVHASCGYAGPAGNAKLLAKNILNVYRLSSAEQAKLGNSARQYHFAHLERNLTLAKLSAFISSN